MFSGPDTQLLLVSLVIFAAVALAVMALAPMFEPKVDLRRRLASADMSAEPNQMRLLTDHTRSPWARLVREIERRGISLADDKADTLSNKLMLAGYSQPHAVRVFVFAKTLLTLGMPALVVAYFTLTHYPGSLNTYMEIVGAAAAGLYLPDFIISSKAGERRKAILNAFPDALDLLLVCVEAGLGIDASFARVGAEITEAHPLLSELFAALTLELRAGRTREDALKNLGRRSGLTEIAAFVALLNQSARLGSSIAQGLRIYAAEMREARRMRAEEKAHRLPVLLSVPVVVFLLPTMIAVLMLPAVIKIRGQFSGGAHVAGH